MTEFRKRHDSGRAFPLDKSGVGASDIVNAAIGDAARQKAMGGDFRNYQTTNEKMAEIYGTNDPDTLSDIAMGYKRPENMIMLGDGKLAGLFGPKDKAKILAILHKHGYVGDYPGEIIGAFALSSERWTGRKRKYAWFTIHDGKNDQNKKGFFIRVNYPDGGNGAIRATGMLDTILDMQRKGDRTAPENLPKGWQSLSFEQRDALLRKAGIESTEYPDYNWDQLPLGARQALTGRKVTSPIFED